MEKLYDSIELSRLKNSTGIVHPRFGDLNRANAFEIDKFADSAFFFSQSNPYFVHLSVTGRCNAQCKGCINSCISFKDQEQNEFLSKKADTNPERDANAIINLLEKTGEKEIAVCFYGGEPLLLSESIDKIIGYLTSDHLPYEFKFMIYTNGQMLDKLIEEHPGLVEKIWLFSVSIDGQADQHNSVRCGTDLDRIHQNLKSLKNLRTGTVLMWSTLREEQSLKDCFDEFMYLYQNGLADQFFWHWVETENPFENLEKYMLGYEADLDGVMREYVNYLEKDIILPITHINELILYLLTGTQRGTSACGVEQNRNFDIAAGKIMACSDMGPAGIIGEIANNGQTHIKEKNLSQMVDYKNDLGCYQCGIHNYCGGRCPVQAFNSTAQRLIEYCQLMRLHTATVGKYIPEIKKLMMKNKITPQQIYNQSAYFTQFTDVTP